MSATVEVDQGRHRYSDEDEISVVDLPAIISEVAEVQTGIADLQAVNVYEPISEQALATINAALATAAEAMDRVHATLEHQRIINAQQRGPAKQLAW